MLLIVGVVQINKKENVKINQVPTALKDCHYPSDLSVFNAENEKGSFIVAVNPPEQG